MFIGGQTIAVHVPKNQRVNRRSIRETPATRITSTRASGEREHTMSRPEITFGTLRHLLLDMGFTENVVPKSHVFFRHDSSGTEIVLPMYKVNQAVRPRHLATARIMLDGSGLMSGDDFDELVASVSAKHSAS